MLRQLAVLAVAACWGFCTAQQAYPQTVESATRLRGLPGARVLADCDEEHIPGFSCAAIQTAIELRLRQSSFRVLSREEQATTAGQPVFVMHVNVMSYTEPGGSVVMHSWAGFAEVREHVQLFRLAVPDMVLPSAATWNTGLRVGVAGSERIEHAIRRFVADTTDAFLNAYLAANPPRRQPDP